MPANISSKISLAGEQEYKKAISELNTALKTMGSEMKLVSERYAENSGSVEALAAKGDVLNRQIDAQKAKVASMQEALKKSAETYGESDTRTQKWQQSLNSAEADLIKMERSLRDNNSQMEAAQQATDDYSGALAKMDEATQQTGEQSATLGQGLEALTDKLGIKLPAGVKNAADKLGTINPKFVAAAAGAAALAAAVVKAEKALIDMTKEAASAADELATLSLQTGISVTDLQKLEYAAEFVDVSVSTITGSITKLTNNMQAARDGSTAMEDNFRRLGVSITNTDGSLRDAREVFYEAIDALGRVGNATERDALAMDIFGKSAQELNPLIIQGSSALRDLGDEAEKTGYVLDDKGVKALTNVDDAVQRFNKRLEGGKKGIAAEFAPAVEDFFDMSTELVGALSKGLKNSGLLEIAKDLLGLVTSIGKALIKGGESVGNFLESMRKLPAGLKGPLEILAAMADTIGLISSVMSGDWDGVKTYLGLNAKNGKLSNLHKFWYGDAAETSVWDAERGTWVGNAGSSSDSSSSAPEYVWDPTIGRYVERTGGNAAGTDYWRGGMTWVGESGPERVWLPSGSRIQTAQESRGGGDVYNITIAAKDVKEFNDIVRIAKNARRAERMGVTG